jgi:hypothetical protein
MIGVLRVFKFFILLIPTVILFLFFCFDLFHVIIGFVFYFDSKNC